MGRRARQFNMPHAVATHLGQRDLDTAFLAHNPAMLEPLVLAAQTFVILHRPENLCTEQAIALRLEGTVVDRFRLLDLAVRPGTDHVGGCQTYSNGIEIISLTLRLQ